MSTGAGRPQFAPTKEQRLLVQVMTAAGFPQEQIAEQIGIDRVTLRKHFRPEIKTGKASANAMVARSLFKKATGDGPQSVAAAIFWLKTQAGWKETTVNEHTGPNGEPLKPPVLNFGFDNGGPGAADPSA